MLDKIKVYRSNFILSIISNILLAVFTVVSIPLLIPFFAILFDRVPLQTTQPEGYDINQWVQYYMSDLILHQGKETALFLICSSMILIFFLKNLFRYTALYFMSPLRYGIIYDLRKQLYRKYLELPLSFYSSERKGALISTMTVDVQEVEWSIINVLESMFRSPIVIAGSIFFMIYINIKLTIFVFVLALFAGLVLGKLVNTLKQESKFVQSIIGNITAQIEETIGGLRVIKGFNAEKYHSEKFERENLSYKSILIKVVNRRDLASPISEFLGVTIVVILLWYGSLLVFKSELKPETFFAFVLAFYQVIEPSKSFSAAYFNIQKGMAALDRINRVINAPNEILSENKTTFKTTFDTSIKFEHVSFQYKDTNQQALTDVNVEIKKGQIVALVGSSGAGKSTFVDLLPRFYNVTNGKITIDGVDTRDLNLSQLRQFFGIVTQDAILFHDTIANNISFGGDYSEEEIQEAAMIANAHDFIVSLPQGYQSNIGDRGLKLSGGQRQRLTIARAILRNPPILILDEATSALDSESEKLVQDALQNVMKSRTSVVVAHRLSTITQADKILVFDQGKIVQSGIHNELINQDGPYQKFVKMQAIPIN